MNAVIDFDQGALCFKSLSLRQWIPSKRARNRYLLLDLTQDWFVANPHFLHDRLPDAVSEQYK